MDYIYEEKYYNNEKIESWIIDSNNISKLDKIKDKTIFDYLFTCIYINKNKIE